MVGRGCPRAAGVGQGIELQFRPLAHYPHNEHTARLADQMGIMVWEEIPVYWTIQWTNADTLKLARRQLAEMILRDQNRASVIVWSVANETPVGEARRKFLKTFVDDAPRWTAPAGFRRDGSPFRSEEPEHKMVDDPFGQYTEC